LNDIILKNIPFLIIFDKYNSQSKVFEELRNNINKLDRSVVNYLFVDFDDGIGVVNLGLEWLCELMKPI
jgi:hypothetical protein